MKCERCGRELTSKASIERGMGLWCSKLSKTTPALSDVVLADLVERMRKVELDNNFMKHQLKHQHFSVTTNPDANLEWQIKPEVQEVIDVFKGEFSSIINELKNVIADNKITNQPLLVKGFRYTDEELGIQIIEVK